MVILMSYFKCMVIKNTFVLFFNLPCFDISCFQVSLISRNHSRNFRSLLPNCYWISILIMNINVPNGNVTDLEVVTISCISRDESQVFDEVDSDSDDSSQTDYVSSMYVEYNTSLLDEMSFSDEAVERELPRQCDGKKYVATSTCTAVQSNHEQADNGISLSVVDVNEEVMQERDSEQSVSREVMELIDNAEYKIVDSAMLNVDVTAEGDMPTCSLEKTLENNSFPEMDIQVKPPNTIEKGDAFSLSSDNPQYIQRELSSAEFNRYV